jgi:catechol 2,3-dioxygenase-like lactoylglutathione lyase family enzyme
VTARPEYRPRLNHVAIAVDERLLDDAGRKDILDFYGDVFGWTEGDNTGERGNPLIMYTGEFGQFVYLAPTPPGDATATAVEHFGLQVSTVAEIEEIVGNARRRRETDDRVQVSEIGARVTRGPEHEYTLTSAYIGFVLPLSIELQNITRRDPT